MDSIFFISTFFGGIGILFFGLKIINDGLQAVFGDFIRKIMSKMSKKPVGALSAGLILTAIIQSSSITTVMSVGLVNAGVMELAQAIGIIFGANVGTTITAWFFTFFSEVNAWLLIGLGFIPALFTKSSYFEQWGKSLIGFGLVFLGLFALKIFFTTPLIQDSLVDWLFFFNQDNYLSFFILSIVAIFLTMLIQSSTAMVGIIMVLFVSSYFSMAATASLIFGANIGTTINALIASNEGNTSAKRAARVHTLFNLLGAIILFCFFEPFLALVVKGTPFFKLPEGYSFYQALPRELNLDGVYLVATIHTFFNLISALLFFPMIKLFEKMIIKMTPANSLEREIPHLLMLGNPQDLIPATSIIQAESEVIKLSDIVARMFALTKEYWNDENFELKKLSKILDYERITDNIHKELTIFLCYVMEKPLSHHQSEQTQALIKIADELESVADYLERLAHYRERFKAGENLEGDSRTEFFDFMNQVHQFYESVMNSLIKKQTMDLSHIREKSEELQIWADSIRDKHLERIARGEYRPVTALTFSDMVVALRKIRTHSMHLANGVQVLNTDLN
jgi:phosphate:Na+ symporter